MNPDMLAIRNALRTRDFHRTRAKRLRLEAAQLATFDPKAAQDTEAEGDHAERIASNCDAYARSCGYRGE